MRAALVTMLLLVVGCHGIQVGAGVGHTFADGGASGSFKRAGTWDVETEDSTTFGVYVSGFVTPQTMNVRHVGDHSDWEQRLYPPPDVQERIEALPLPMKDEPAPPPKVEEPPCPAPDGVGFGWVNVLGCVAGLLIVAVGLFQIACLLLSRRKKAPRAPRGKR